MDAELGFCLAAICYTGFEAGTSSALLIDLAVSLVFLCLR